MGISNVKQRKDWQNQIIKINKTTVKSFQTQVKKCSNAYSVIHNSFEFSCFIEDTIISRPIHST